MVKFREFSGARRGKRVTKKLKIDEGTGREMEGRRLSEVTGSGLGEVPEGAVGRRYAAKWEGNGAKR